MKTGLLIVLIHIISAIKCANITIGAIVDGKEANHIQDLEKEKTEIYNQLNEAVEDTIKTLEKTNDSDARQGITYMKDLISLIGDFNSTNLAKLQTVCNGTECPINETSVLKSPKSSFFSGDGRRSRMKVDELKLKNTGHDHIKQAIIKSGIFKKTDDLERKKEEKVKNLMVLQGKLDKWLKLREVEKQKIKQYKARQASQKQDTVSEVCPDFGEKKGEKKKDNNGGKSNKYPCCRKCCKSSYMGCL